MIANILTTVESWWHSLCRLIRDDIHHLQPDQYFIVLLATALFGWLLLRSVNRR